jgi:hypothetical protein
LVTDFLEKVGSVDIAEVAENLAPETIADHGRVGDTP